MLITQCAMNAVAKMLPAPRRLFEFQMLAELLALRVLFHDCRDPKSPRQAKSEMSRAFAEEHSTTSW